MDKIKIFKPHIILFILGFVGVLSILPVIPQLFELQGEEPPMPLWVIQALALIQSAVLLFVMVWLGASFSKKVTLISPVIQAAAESKNIYKAVKPQIVPALLGGISGGIFLVIFFNSFATYLPPEFIIAGEKLNPPWYAKILYGGITEEILIRWGVMSFLIWGLYRITQKKGCEIKSYNYILGIVLSSLVFGAGHLPAAFALSPEVSANLIAYIIVGNAIFGFIAGYLFWKWGLECAIGAHMVAHITMIIGNGIV